RTGAVLPNIAPSNVYPTADGEWILVAANQDTVFSRLAQAMGQPELADDSRYATHGARGQHQEELDELVGRFTSLHSAKAVEELLHQHGVPVGKIFRAEDMLTDPHLKARDSITTVRHPVLGDVSMQNVFPKLSRS